jgi:hypothetical protein
MEVTHAFVPATALCALGAILLFVPLFSASFPATFSIPAAACWLFAWCLDARFTARHWQLVVGGREANVFLLALSRIAPQRPALVFVAHAAFSVGAAAGLQALVTHSLDCFVMSCVLAVFGALHVDAFCRSRAFVMEMVQAGDGTLRPGAR